MRLIIILLATILLTSSCSKEDANPLTNPIIWQKEINDDGQLRFIWDPINYDDLIIYPLKSFENHTGKLVAFNKLNGKIEWEWLDAFEEYGVDGFEMKSYISNDILICGKSNLTYGIDPNTGATLWKTKGDIYNVPHFFGLDEFAYTREYIPDENYYIKQTSVLNGNSKQLFEFSRNDEYKAFMGVPYAFKWEGKSYVTVITAKWISSDKNYWLNLYDLDNDKLVWTSDTIPLQIPLSGIPGLRPQFNEGKILLANDAIYSYNITDGSLAWRADYGNTFVLNSHITAADGKVWGNNDSGFCVGLDVHTGEELFNVDTGGSTSRILYHENKIYLGSATSLKDGINYLFILDATTGQLLKQLEAPYFNENWEWHFNRNMEIDPETGLLYTGDHRYAMCIDPWK